MTPRLGFSLIAGFGALIVLTAVLGIVQVRRASRIQHELVEAQEAYSTTAALLSQTRVDLYRIGMDVRDYLLDRSAKNSSDLKKEMINTRTQIRSNLNMLEKRLSPDQREPLDRLRDEVEDYFEWTQPTLDWSQDEKLAFSGMYVRGVLLKRRTVIGDLADQVAMINASNLERARHRLNTSQSEFQSWLRRLTVVVVLMSVLVAAVSMTWILRLEKQAEAERDRAESAERALRRLSQQQVKSQEEERRSLSRELHDDVGQQLTALRVEIANLGRIPAGDRDVFQSHLADAKALAERTMRTVRDLAMGLRPSMLDDLGLGPALEWQAREFSRRTGVPATVKMEGSTDGLADLVKTSLFRIVQEALNNITKHAQASEVRIHFQSFDEGLKLEVEDNGKGMVPLQVRGKGLGLVGIEERAREMGGEFSLESEPGRGTRIEIYIPRRLAA